MLENVQLVIWDLDGTLIDSFGVFSTVLTEAALLSGRQTPSVAELRHHFHGTMEDAIKSSLNMVDGEDVITILNDFHRIQDQYYIEPEQHLFADAYGLVRRLAKKDIVQIIATNRRHSDNGHGSPRHIVSGSSLKPYISEVICGDDVTYRKPDARVLDNSSAYKQARAEQIVVIGDQFVDAELARNLGVRSIIVNRTDGELPHAKKAGPEVTIVKSLEEVH